jgi:hypothetical protein
VLVKEPLQLSLAEAQLIEESRGIGSDDRPDDDRRAALADAVSDREQGAL